MSALEVSGSAGKRNWGPHILILAGANTDRTRVIAKIIKVVREGKERSNELVEKNAAMV